MISPRLLLASAVATSCALSLAFAAKAQETIGVVMGKPDKDLQRVLDAQASLNPKPIETLTPQEARLQPTPADGVKLVMKQKGLNPADDLGVTTKDMTLPGDIALRLYFPQAADKHKPLPVVVYYHGGGFVIADLDTYDATPRETAKAVKAIVVSVGYRRAPENKFPAAHDDAFDAYKWVVANAASFGGDPKRIAVMGESAGGNLAINTAIAARDNKVQMPVHETLIYPVAGTDLNTPSYTENAAAKPLNKPMMKWFMKQLVSRDADLRDPRLDLVNRSDLQGLPPTTIIADQIDPLRSEDEALAAKLKAAGVKVASKIYQGMTHEFFGMGAVVAKARDAEDRVNGELKAALRK